MNKMRRPARCFDNPKVGQQVIKLPVGNVTMHIFTAEFPKQTGEMVVSYADYPAQALATTKPKHTTEPGLLGVKVRNVHVASDGKLTYTLKIQVTPDEALDEGKESVLAAARDKLAEDSAARSSRSPMPRSPAMRATRIGLTRPVPSLSSSRPAPRSLERGPWYFTSSATVLPPRFRPPSDSSTRSGSITDRGTGDRGTPY